jgi:hypothetical protein
MPHAFARQAESTFAQWVIYVTLSKTKQFYWLGVPVILENNLLIVKNDPTTSGF